MITVQEETCYRLRHHLFDGLTMKETAKEMGISIRKVRTLMNNLKTKIPQLFPILNYHQYLIYWLYTTKGLTTYKIAFYLGTCQPNIWQILNRIKKKGALFCSSKLLLVLNYNHKTGLITNHFIGHNRQLKCPYLIAIGNVDN